MDQIKVKPQINRCLIHDFTVGCFDLKKNGSNKKVYTHNCNNPGLNVFSSTW